MRTLYLAIIVISLSSCDKCKECFLIEEANGNRNEISIGEFCGDEIDAKESEELLTSDGEAYFECK